MNDLLANTMRVCYVPVAANLYPLIEVHMQPSDGVGHASPGRLHTTELLHGYFGNKLKTETYNCPHLPLSDTG